MSNMENRAFRSCFLCMAEKTAVDCAIINSVLVREVPFSALLLKSMKGAMPLMKNRAFAMIQAKFMYVSDDDFLTSWLSYGSMEADCLTPSRAFRDRVLKIRSLLHQCLLGMLN